LKAEQLLLDVGCREISAEDAAAFVGKPITPVPGTGFYLARGVYLNRGTGSFSIAIKGERLWVDHGCLGRTPVPMKRQALVLQLPRLPSEVYVTCGMAE